MSEVPLSPHHPSAGNLHQRPALVRDGEPAPGLPALAFPHGADLAPTRVYLGPDLTTSGLDRLVGNVAGKRVLDLGCGGGVAAVAMARAGARVIAVEPSGPRLAQARRLAEAHEVRIEFHHGDLADLAFVRADTVDVCTAVYALAGVADLGRVFRQVHRVLRPEAPMVMSLPHPMACMLTADEDEPTPTLVRTAWDSEAVPWRAGGDDGLTHVHQVSEVFTSLSRANFRVDVLAEPAADEEYRGVHASAVHDWVPSTLVVRARKQGI